MPGTHGLGSTMASLRSFQGLLEAPDCRDTLPTPFSLIGVSCAHSGFCLLCGGTPVSHSHSTVN